MSSNLIAMFLETSLLIFNSLVYLVYMGIVLLYARDLRNKLFLTVWTQQSFTLASIIDRTITTTLIMVVVSVVLMEGAHTSECMWGGWFGTKPKPEVPLPSQIPNGAGFPSQTPNDVAGNANSAPVINTNKQPVNIFLRYLKNGCPGTGENTSQDITMGGVKWGTSTTVSLGMEKGQVADIKESLQEPVNDFRGDLTKQPGGPRKWTALAGLSKVQGALDNKDHSVPRPFNKNGSCVEIASILACAPQDVVKGWKNQGK